jgi:uncharacterized membrane protein
VVERVTSSKAAWIASQITSRLWFRVSLYGLGAVVSALVAVFAAPLVPEQIAGRIEEGTARNILSILASSMLVVATFSLGTMVQAFAAAAQSATPRATNILIDDPFSQNVLSTFLGAFVFSMVGLVALSLDYYTQAGEVVLVVAAAVVIAIVIASFFGWLDHLVNLVRLGATVAKIVERTETALNHRAAAPHLGGVPVDEGARSGHPVRAVDTGYVRHVDPNALQEVAEAAGGSVAVKGMPGELADPFTPLAWTSWPADDDDQAAIRKAFTLGPERSFDQDPRFCLQVLSEIASRALSPGINDPGTAIGVIAGQQRLLTTWAEARGRGGDEAAFPRVKAPALDTVDLFEDAFGPLLRDASALLEVGLRLQKSLSTLATGGPPDFAEAARALSERALAQSDEALRLETDRDRLHAAAAPMHGGGDHAP